MGKNIVLTASANRGLGFFTAIGVGFSMFFGFQSKALKKKKEWCLRAAKQGLEEQLAEYPGYEIVHVKEFWSGKLDVALVAVASEISGQEAPKQIEFAPAPQPEPAPAPQPAPAVAPAPQPAPAPAPAPQPAPAPAPRTVKTKIALQLKDEVVAAGTVCELISEDATHVIVALPSGKKIKIAKANVE